jgi:hypothetical protein
MLCVEVFENKSQRIIFGREREAVTGGWRKLNNEEFHNLYSSPNIILFSVALVLGEPCILFCNFDKHLVTRLTGYT